MVDDASHVSRTLEDIKAQIAAKIAEAARLLPTANLLAEMIQAPHLTLSEFVAEYDEDAGSAVVTQSPGAKAGAPSSGRAGSTRHLKPDTFLGDPPLDAAKKYIGMVGHAVHMDEITSAVERGGAAVKGSDWRDKLELGLVRSTHDVVKVQDNTYGLVTFYTQAQIDNLRGSRRREKPKPKRGKGRDKTAKTVKAGSAKAKVPKAEASDSKPPEPAAKESEAPTGAEQVH